MADIPSPPPEKPGGDDSARREGRVYQSGDVPPDLIEAKHDLTRHLIKIREKFLQGVKHIAYFVPWAILVMVLVWLWHIIGPPSARWLDKDEISHVQSLLFSGAISALATVIATKTL